MKKKGPEKQKIPAFYFCVFLSKKLSRNWTKIGQKLDFCPVFNRTLRSIMDIFAKSVQKNWTTVQFLKRFWTAKIANFTRKNRQKQRFCPKVQFFYIFICDKKLNKIYNNRKISGQLDRTIFLGVSIWKIMVNIMATH